ncbi:MAG: SDR family oxidoreductase [Rhodospirillaceae bacterium]|nr:SDR family oxidoreductase [Rhodospirillaceae bacterium]
MKIIVTGACGYKGSILVPRLLAEGHTVVGFDTQWFGRHLPEHPNLHIEKMDTRELDERTLPEADAIVHLAGVANDPCGDLNPALTWEVGASATMRLADAAVRVGIPHFVFASSASVYGIKDEEQIVEHLPLKPISVYNRAKMVAERVLLSYADRMIVQIVRPATVCGLSPRMRLDVAVNLLTMQALSRRRITVLGGGQYRPNIHVQDIAELYCWLLKHPDVRGVFNAGNENLTVMEIAETAASITGAQIVVEPSNDPRSYRLDSSKLRAAGFAPQRTVRSAIEEIIAAFRSRDLIEHENMYNVNWMRGRNFT